MFRWLFKKEKTVSAAHNTKNTSVQPPSKAAESPKKVYPDTLYGKALKYIDDNYRDLSHVRFSINTLDFDDFPDERTHKTPQDIKRPVQNGEYTIWIQDFSDGQTFSTSVKNMMEAEGITASELCSRVYMDRRLFSKLNTDINYQPSKETAIALCLALRLSLNETQVLLKKAGYALSNTIRYDMAIQYFLLNNVYDIDQINEVLDELHMKCFGAKA